MAEVDIDGNIHNVHVKNTGRCKELLQKGCTVYLTKSDNPQRKTQYDLICVEKVNDDLSTTLFNIDSQAPNELCEEWLKEGNLIEGIIRIKREVKYKNSRFDFYIETKTEKIFAEVKGVTLDVGGVALFPDAPTQRGIKHINELINARNEGYSAHIIFVLQYKGAKEFAPNEKMHPEFANVLRLAKEKGVIISAVDCRLKADEAKIDEFVKVKI